MNLKLKSDRLHSHESHYDLQNMLMKPHRVHLKLVFDILVSFAYVWSLMLEPHGPLEAWENITFTLEVKKSRLLEDI